MNKPLCCPECGNPYSDLIPAFEYAKTILAKSILEYDPDEAKYECPVEMLFDLLDIPARVCCRAHINQGVTGYQFFDQKLISMNNK